MPAIWKSRCKATSLSHRAIRRHCSIGEGVVSAPLSKYYRYHTRICRPVGLSQEDCGTVCNYAIDRIGFDYDLRNIIDLMRYLVPLPVPQRWRRRMIALGSGTPTRIICSARKFESEAARREILEIRHSSLYAPRDFDISPADPGGGLQLQAQWTGPICRRNHHQYLHIPTSANSRIEALSRRRRR